MCFGAIMTFLAFTALDFFFYLTMVAFIFVCVILILLVLIQKGRGGGLSSAFGGGGGNTAFGSKTGDVLTWGTSIVFGGFLLLSITFRPLADRQNCAGAPMQRIRRPPQPAAPRPPGKFRRKVPHLADSEHAKEHMIISMTGFG